jgi:hypothetical protein
METSELGNFVDVAVGAPPLPIWSLSDDQISQLISYQLKLFDILVHEAR